VTQRERQPVVSWLAWGASCLGEALLLLYILPAAVAFLWLVFFAGDLVVISTWLYVVVILLLVVAPLAVLFTATLGYLRAKGPAAEREMAEERELETGGGS